MPTGVYKRKTKNYLKNLSKSWGWNKGKKSNAAQLNALNEGRKKAWKNIKKRLHNPVIARKISRALIGRKLSKEHIENVRRALKGKYTGEKIANWRGDKVGKAALHNWVERRLGKPKKCEHCKTTNAKKFEWANKSQLYKRDLKDFIRLCTKCHIAYDRSMCRGPFKDKISELQKYE